MTALRQARAAAGAIVALGLATAPASAQFFRRPPSAASAPCVLDKCVNGAADRAGPPPATNAPAAPTFGGAAAPGRFDFYVLALSWSPGFCDTGGAGKAPDQCAAGAGLGFVVHGLWPQFTRGFPSDCDSNAGGPSRTALEQTRGVYPDIGLARYEWRKHGTCTGLSPTEYFAAVRRARDALAIPPALARPTEPQTLAPLDIARAFVASNAGLRTDMMAVTCRQGELQEVRVCFSKDLRGFTVCPDVARGACRTRSVSVLPVQ